MVVQGGSKETLRLFGEPHSVTRVRAATFNALADHVTAAVLADLTRVSPHSITDCPLLTTVTTDVRAFAPTARTGASLRPEAIGRGSRGRAAEWSGVLRTVRAGMLAVIFLA